MTNQERQTLDQFRKINNDIGYIRGEHSMWLNPELARLFAVVPTRRSVVITVRFARAFR